MESLSYLNHSDASLTSHHSFAQDKKEERGTALLGLTLRGMQVYQVRACVSVLLMHSKYVNTYVHEGEAAFAQRLSLCICSAGKPRV